MSYLPSWLKSKKPENITAKLRAATAKRDIHVNSNMTAKLRAATAKRGIQVNSNVSNNPALVRGNQPATTVSGGRYRKSRKTRRKH
jgi:hypothetical protein